MREKHKLKKIASGRFEPAVRDITNKLESEFPETAEETPAKKTARGFYFKRIAAGASAAAALFAVLLCVILLPDREGNNPGHWASKPAPTFFYSESIEYNISEYNAQNGTDILYFDWYDGAASCSNKLHYYRTGLLVGIEEKIENGTTHDKIAMLVEFDDMEYEYFELSKICTNEKFISEYGIKWATDEQYAYAVFEYGGLRYSLVLIGNPDENRLFELAEELLP